MCVCVCVCGGGGGGGGKSGQYCTSQSCGSGERIELDESCG